MSALARDSEAWELEVTDHELIATGRAVIRASKSMCKLKFAHTFEEAIEMICATAREVKYNERSAEYAGGW